MSAASEPVVSWSATPPSKNGRARAIGAAMGFAVGIVCSVLAALVVGSNAAGGAMTLPFALSLTIVLGIPAGTIAGLCYGPTAWHTTGLGWLWVVFAASICAVLAGLAWFAIMIGVAGAMSSDPGAAGSGLMLAAFVMLFGLVLAPTALVPAAVGSAMWSVSMWLLRRRFAD